jgi:hypothetical protein
MPSEVNLFSYIITAIVGIGCGLLVGFKLRWPKSVFGFIIIAIVGALSPWLMTTSWAIAIQSTGSSVYGIHIGYWLTFFCATVAVAYVFRAAKAKGVVAQG